MKLGRREPVDMSKFFISRSTAGYFVCNPRGVRVSDHVQFKAEADRLRVELQRAEDVKRKRGQRACMCCGTSFASEGIHHRLCGNCRRHTDSLGDPQRPYLARAR